MHFVNAIAMLAILQYLFFAGLVGKARGKFGVRAPAVAGDARFECIYRVQMNTLELLVGLIPAMYVAASYWPPKVVASVGAVYLVGRILYWRAYVSNPSGRGLGYMLSILPVLGLALAALVPAVLNAIAA